VFGTCMRVLAAQCLRLTGSRRALRQAARNWYSGLIPAYTVTPGHDVYNKRCCTLCYGYVPASKWITV
jgi:hypothetical protein